MQWRFLHQGWDTRNRSVRVDGTSHSVNAAASAEVTLRVRAYSTTSSATADPWASPWREVTRVPPAASAATVSIGDASARESGDGSAVTMRFPVTLNRRVDATVTVEWETVDGTALAGQDYTSASGTLTFAAEDVDQTIEVTVLDDSVHDSGETFTVLLSDPSENAALGDARGTGRIWNQEDAVLTGFSLVDASTQDVLAELTDGAAVTLDDPDGGSFGIRADADAAAEIGSVRLELSGAKAVSSMENRAPYSLYGDANGTLHGESLPAGSYTLTVTAYSEGNGNGDTLATLSASFTVAETVEDTVEETAEQTTALSATFPASAYASRSHSGPGDRPQVVAFSEPVASFAAGTASVAVTGATVNSVQAHREEGLENGFLFFLAPVGNGPIGFRLLADVACADGGICTSDGRELAEAPGTLTIPGEESENTPATGAPTIGGTARVDETLTADTSGISDDDGLTNVSYSYQWIRSDSGDDTDIDGASDSTYTLVSHDQGKTIRVSVSFTDDGGNDETLTSAATATVEDAFADTAEADLADDDTTTGTVQVGGSVRGTVGVADDIDAYAVELVAGRNYRIDLEGAETGRGTLADPMLKWMRDASWTGYGGTGDDNDGEGRNARAYVEPQTGGTWYVLARSKGSGTGTYTLTVTEETPASANTPATGLPTVSGTVQAGQTLTVDTSGITHEDGLTNVSYSYQWIRSDGGADTDIAEATDSTYELVAADEGKTIRVRVSFTDDAGNDETLTSAPTGTVTAADPPPQTNTPASGQPTISGTARVNETLTADTSGITDDDGTENATFAYQWIRNDGTDDTDIQGSTGSTYTLSDADLGRTIRVRVSFTDDAGNDETLTSAATDEVAARPNTPATGAPTISGTVQAGETLTADTSGIDDTDGLTSVSYSYQWIRSDGGTDTDISGETASTYTVSDADVGKTIKVRVSFTDNRGNGESLTSAATAPVEEAPQLPLTVGTHGVPQSHDGENVFTFELRFSEELKSGFSFKTLKFHAFTVNGGEIRRAKRLVKTSNAGWTIHVQPDGSGGVTIVLPVTTDCDAEHAICTGDGRPLSNRLELTVSGPGG